MPRLTSESTVCPKRSCKGTLFNVSSRLAQSQGVMTLQCDRCRGTAGVRVKEPEEVQVVDVAHMWLDLGGEG